MVTIQELLAEARQRGASDVHISVGIPPKFRIHGILQDFVTCPRLMPEDTEKIIQPMLSKRTTETLGMQQGREAVIYEPGGCHMCNNTGYYGRIGVYEIMEVTPKLKEIISKHGNADEINKVAMSQGMKTLRVAAARYVLSGVTSISEMKRIAFE